MHEKKEVRRTQLMLCIKEMDNAIVDIWKEGVEYWGYKYSKNLSLPGKTKIVHN